MTNPITVIKAIDRIANSDKLSLERIEKLELRYKSAAGQQQSVIGEVFHLLRHSHTQFETVTGQFETVISRIEALENR